MMAFDGVSSEGSTASEGVAGGVGAAHVAAGGMQVPFVDLKAQHQALWGPLREAVDDVMRTGQFILGPAVQRFETAFAAYVGARGCVGLNNGTTALHMALIACGIKAGDEVITTPHTWISTSWAISYVSATPVFVDIDPKTYTLDPALVEKAITSRTKAVLPVHLYGQAADVQRLSSLCDAHDLVLIEDAAQAHGAMIGGRKVGTFGRAGCFSFYPGKNLGACGEAGAVVSNDPDILDRIRSLRDHAQQGRHNHVELGFNTRMEGLQGAVLAVKLHYLDGWTAARKAHAERYRTLLARQPGLTLPEPGSPGSHVWHLFVALVDGVDRARFCSSLQERGVATGIHYPRLVPFQPAYAHLGHRPGDFPVAEAVAARCVSLPMFPELTEEQMQHVVRAIETALR
jgi:dTDP-4-amino-4,6-dideoxygalactose transaminase